MERKVITRGTEFTHKTTPFEELVERLAAKARIPLDDLRPAPDFDHMRPTQYVLERYNVEGSNEYV